MPLGGFQAAEIMEAPRIMLRTSAVLDRLLIDELHEFLLQICPTVAILREASLLLPNSNAKRDEIFLPSP